MRTIPQAALAFIAKWEGMKLKAYRCSAGVPTIGVGHIDGVKMGDTCTREQAMEWLADDLKDARGKLYAAVKAERLEALTDNQFAALLSFAFNLGFSKSWGIARALNAGNFDAVPSELMRFVNAAGKRVEGLAKRRTAECTLWLTGDPTLDRAPVSLAVTRAPGTTPPTPTSVTPPSKTPAFLAGGAAAVASAGPMVDQARNVLAPYAEHSDALRQALGILAAVGGALAVLALVLTWLKAKEAHR